MSSIGNGSSRARILASDWVVLSLLGVIAATFSLRLPAVPEARASWELQVALLLAFAAVVAVMALAP